MKLSKNVVKQLDAARTLTLDGVILEGIDDAVILIPCYCGQVQDTPENPCICPVQRRIIVSNDDLVGEVEALERRSHDGERLSRITVGRSARVLLEESRPVDAATAASASSAPAQLAPAAMIGPLVAGGIPAGLVRVILEILETLKTGGPLPLSDPSGTEEDGDVVPYALPAAWLIVSALITAGGAIAGGLLSRENCDTETRTETKRNPDGSTTTTTVVTKKCRPA